jgi:hypothetical protein
MWGDREPVGFSGTVILPFLAFKAKTNVIWKRVERMGREDRSQWWMLEPD